MKLSRIVSLYRNELAKHIRQRFLYVALVLLALIAVLWTRNAELIAPVNRMSGYLALALGLIAVITSIIPVFVVVFASMLVAGETSGGTFRMILSRPVTRAEFLSAKILMALTFPVFLILFFIIACAISSIGLYSFGPIMEDEQVLLSSAAIAGNLVFAILLTFLPLAAAVAYGIFMSVISRSLTTAIGSALAIVIALDTVKHILRIGDFRITPYLFSSYFDEFLKIAQNYAQGLQPQWFNPTPDILAIVVPLVTIVLFLSLSFAIFTRRDLND